MKTWRGEAADEVDGHRRPRRADGREQSRAEGRPAAAGRGNNSADAEAPKAHGQAGPPAKKAPARKPATAKKPD